MANKTNTGYVAQSTINPMLIMETSGKFVSMNATGPGMPYSAKVFKTESGARKANGRVNNAIRIEDGILIF